MNTVEKELYRRFKLDQKFCGKDYHRFEEVCFENTAYLKNLISNIGWPSEGLVGVVGEQSAWLIAQHSDHDPEFQQQCLDIIKSLPESKERKKYTAFLTDRVLINKNQKQLFGTQFYNGAPYPIKDLDNLDQRRKNQGLESFADYKIRLEEK